MKGFALSGLIAVMLVSSLGAPGIVLAAGQQAEQQEGRRGGPQEGQGGGGRDEREAELVQKTWFQKMLGPTQIKYLLMMGAVLILGAVVLPRLAGWVFHPKSQSFIIVLIVVGLGVALWQRDVVIGMVEEKSPFFIGGAILMACFIALIFIAKERRKED